MFELTRATLQNIRMEHKEERRWQLQEEEEAQGLIAVGGQKP